MKGVGGLIWGRGDIRSRLYASVLAGAGPAHSIVDRLGEAIIGRDVTREIGSRVLIRVLIDIYNQRSDE